MFRFIKRSQLRRSLKALEAQFFELQNSNIENLEALVTLQNEINNLQKELNSEEQLASKHSQAPQLIFHLKRLILAVFIGG